MITNTFTKRNKIFFILLLRELKSRELNNLLKVNWSFSHHLRLLLTTLFCLEDIKHFIACSRG